MSGSLTVAQICVLTAGKHGLLFTAGDLHDKRLGDQRDPFGSTAFPDLSEIEASCEEEREGKQEADQVDCITGYSLCKLRNVFRSRVLEWAELPQPEVVKQVREAIGQGGVKSQLEQKQASQSSSPQPKSQSVSARAKSAQLEAGEQVERVFGPSEARLKLKQGQASQSSSAQLQSQEEEQKEQKGDTSGSSKPSASQAADFQIAYTKYDLKATGNDRIVEMKTTPWF